MEERARDNTDVQGKINQIKELIKQKKSSGQKAGLGTGTKVAIGVGLLAVVAGVMLWLAKGRE